MSTDTFDRSMDHWSERGRGEMDAFYAVATMDYRVLAESRDWSAWLGDADRILDVACGSGKFPAALSRYAGLGPRTRTLDLLDPARFSIDEARKNLEPPFEGGASFECTIQELPETAGPWPVVWATHALYAVPPSELDAGLERFARAIAPEGKGFIAHARAESFYMSFHRAYLEGMKAGAGTPFSTAEDLIAAFERLGVDVEVEDVSYVGGLPADARATAEGYLQRCLFDDAVSLDDMLADPALGALLRDNFSQDEGFRFPQKVALISL